MPYLCFFIAVRMQMPTRLAQGPAWASLVSLLVLTRLSSDISCLSQDKGFAILQIQCATLSLYMFIYMSPPSQNFPFLYSLHQVNITLHKIQLRYLFHDCFSEHILGGTAVPSRNSHWICFSFLTLYYNFILASPPLHFWTVSSLKELTFRSYSCFSSTKSCAWHILVNTRQMCVGWKNN